MHVNQTQIIYLNLHSATATMQQYIISYAPLHLLDAAQQLLYPLAAEHTLATATNHGHPNQQNDAQNKKVMKNNLIELVTNANIRATCKSEE